MDLAGVVPASASVAVEAGHVSHLEVNALLSDGGSKECDHERGRRRTKEGVAAPRSSLRTR